MSKIQESLDAIGRFLDAADQSSTPAMRSVAEVYRAACVEVNARLGECRRLIDAGLLSEAERLNRRLSPSLTERAGMLDFPRCAEWCEFCRLYDWPSPPPIDRATVEKLAAGVALAADLNALVRRWRLVARDGGSAEKIRVLRQLVAADPAGSRVWKENLAEVERSRFAELLRDGKLAAEHGDVAELQRIYSELVSPELLTQPERGPLAELAAALAELQQKELRRREETLLDGIASAYSAMDRNALERKLEEWRILCSEPGFQPAQNGLRQVEDARKWLEECREWQERERRFSELEVQLTDELDNEAGLRSVESSFNMLMALDLPVSSRLVERVERYRESCLLAERRRHIRKCIYGIGGALLLVLLVAVAVRLVQNERESREAGRQMEELLAEKNAVGALAVYDRVRRDSPALAERPELLALRARAGKLADEFAAADAGFARLLERAEEALTPERVENSEAAELFRKLGSMSAGRAQPLLDRFDAADRKRRKLLEENRERRTREFRAASERIRRELERISAEIPREGSSLEQLEQAVRAAGEEFSTLLRNASGVAGNLKQQQQELVNIAVGRADGALRTTAKLRSIRQRLTVPADFWSYAGTLETLAVEAPSLADANRKRAAGLLGLWRSMLEQPVEAGILESPEKLKERLAAIPAGEAALPVALDLAKFAPPGIAYRDPVAAVKEKLDKLEREVIADSDLYELILADAAGGEYRFYSVTEPKVLFSSTGVAKSMELAVSLHSGQEGIPFYLQLWRTDGSEGGRSAYRFQPSSQTALEKLAFPKDFVELRGVDMKQPVFQKAAHYRFLARAAARLRDAKTLEEMERETGSLIRSAVENREMNPYMKVVAVKRLLELLRAFSFFYDVQLTDILYRLDRSNAGRNWNWRNPRELVDHPDEVREMEAALAALDVTRLFDEVRLYRKLWKTALLRKFQAVGTVEEKAGGELTLRLFAPVRFRELWVVDSVGKDKFRILCLPDSAAGGRIPEEFRRYCFPGQVLFAPVDWRSTGELAAAFRKEAAERGSRIDMWPQSWPLNRRGREDE